MKQLILLLLFVAGSSAVQAQFRNPGKMLAKAEIDSAFIINEAGFLPAANQLLTPHYKKQTYANVHPDLIKPLRITGWILDGLLDNDPYDRFKVRAPFEMRAYKSNTASEYQAIYNTYRFFIKN